MEEKELEKNTEDIVLNEDEIKVIKDVPVIERKESEVKEEVKEEKKEEEKKPATIVYSDENLKKIEDLRSEFYETYKKGNVWKWVFTILGLGLIIFGFIGVPNMFPNDDQGTLRISLMIICAVLSLATMGLYTFFSRRKVNKQVRAYFDSVYECLDKFTFTREGLEVTPAEERTISKVAFCENDIFKNVVEVNSRDLKKAKYHGYEFSIVDAAAQINNGKRMTPVFVGKYIEAPTTYEGGSILIYQKGDKRSIAPTNIDDLKLVFDNEKTAIYSNESDWEKVVNSKFKAALNKIKIDKTLIDIIIMMRNKKLYICMNYDDSLMILPLENQYNPFPNEEFKDDFEKILDFIDLLNK